jgi:hypothetical protein
MIPYAMDQHQNRTEKESEGERQRKKFKMGQTNEPTCEETQGCE